MRLVCPSKYLEKKERIQELFRNIDAWINSDALNSLITLFGGEVFEGTLSEKIIRINEFANIWDYRKKIVEKNQVNERWNITDDEFVKKHSDFIYKIAGELCLVDKAKPLLTPDFILPLGGARLSNLQRPLEARTIVDTYGYQNAQIVALSGMRPINEKERESVDTYAPEAVTEFDAMNKGLEKAFDLDGKYEEKVEVNENINLSSCVRYYLKNNGENKIISIAAPSSDPSRRANSRDTYKYFLEKFNINRDNNLLLVTSQIYTSYQLLNFVDFAIEGGFDVDCVGTQMETVGVTSNASLYLQEIKGTINAIKELYKKYIGDK